MSAPSPSQKQAELLFQRLRDGFRIQASKDNAGQPPQQIPTELGKVSQETLMWLASAILLNQWMTEIIRAHREFDGFTNDLHAHGLRPLTAPTLKELGKAASLSRWFARNLAQRQRKADEQVDKALLEHARAEPEPGVVDEWAKRMGL